MYDLTLCADFCVKVSKQKVCLRLPTLRVIAAPAGIGGSRRKEIAKNFLQFAGGFSEQRRAKAPVTGQPDSRTTRCRQKRTRRAQQRPAGLVTELRRRVGRHRARHAPGRERWPVQWSSDGR